MLDNPKLSAVLEDLIGAHTWGNFYGAGQEAMPSFRLDHLNVHTHVKSGHKAEGLHGGTFSSHAGGSQFFRYHDGHFYNGLLVVAYELQDTVANDGGFGECRKPVARGCARLSVDAEPRLTHACHAMTWRRAGCIPGTHKGNFVLPSEWADPNSGGPPNLRRVPAEAGDAIIFTEAVSACLCLPAPL
jgi:hypothetical protein